MQPSTLNPDRIKSLELSLQEQRKDFDFLNGIHESLRVRTIAYLASGLGLLAYLYTTTGKGSIRERLFIPTEIYGIIFYFTGVILLVGSVLALMYALVKVRNWATAFDPTQDKSKLDNYEGYLEYMGGRYDYAASINGRAYAARSQVVSSAFVPLVAGGIILLLLKTFGE